jgi:hypothetical protein
MFAEALGWKPVPASVIEGALFLHWNGGRKPWLENGLHREWWRKYDKGTLTII